MAGEARSGRCFYVVFVLGSGGDLGCCVPISFLFELEIGGGVQVGSLPLKEPWHWLHPL